MIVKSCAAAGAVGVLSVTMHGLGVLPVAVFRAIVALLTMAFRVFLHFA